MFAICNKASACGWGADVRNAALVPLQSNRCSKFDIHGRKTTPDVGNAITVPSWANECCKSDIQTRKTRLDVGNAASVPPGANRCCRFDIQARGGAAGCRKCSARSAVRKPLLQIRHPDKWRGGCRPISRSGSRDLPAGCVPAAQNRLLLQRKRSEIHDHVAAPRHRWDGVAHGRMGGSWLVRGASQHFQLDRSCAWTVQSCHENHKSPN